MRRYDGIYLLSDTLKNEALETGIVKVESVIEQAGGVVERKVSEEDGTPVRVLKRQSAGTYVEITFELEPDKVRGLDAAHQLDLDVKRVMIVLARKPKKPGKTDETPKDETPKDETPKETPKEQTTEGVTDGISK